MDKADKVTEDQSKEDESLEDESSQDSLGSAEANNSHSCGSEFRKVGSVSKLSFIISEISFFSSMPSLLILRALFLLFVRRLTVCWMTRRILIILIRNTGKSAVILLCVK